MYESFLQQSKLTIDLPGKKHLKNVKKSLMSHQVLTLVKALIPSFEIYLIYLRSTQQRLSSDVCSSSIHRSITLK